MQARCAMIMADVDRGEGPLGAMWREVEGAVVALALDDAEPGAVQATLEAAIARCTADLDAAGLALSAEGRARLARARRLVRDAAARRDDAGSRELRHDIGATAVSYAREAASRAVDGFRRLVP